MLLGSTQESPTPLCMDYKGVHISSNDKFVGMDLTSDKAMLTE